MGMKIGPTTMENSMKISPYIKNWTTIKSNNSTSRYLFKENENANLKMLCTPKVPVELFTVAKPWKEPERPWWMNG